MAIKADPEKFKERYLADTSRGSGIEKGELRELLIAFANSEYDVGALAKRLGKDRAWVQYRLNRALQEEYAGRLK